jgi:hypothetical protein
LRWTEQHRAAYLDTIEQITDLVDDLPRIPTMPLEYGMSVARKLSETTVKYGKDEQERAKRKRLLTNLDGWGSPVRVVLDDVRREAAITSTGVDKEPSADDVNCHDKPQRRYDTEYQKPLDNWSCAWRVPEGFEALPEQVRDGRPWRDKGTVQTSKVLTR